MHGRSATRDVCQYPALPSYGYQTHVDARDDKAYPNTGNEMDRTGKQVGGQGEVGPLHRKREDHDLASQAHAPVSCAGTSTHELYHQPGHLHDGVTRLTSGVARYCSR